MTLADKRIFQTVQRLNWLYGKGDLVSVVRVSQSCYMATAKKQYGTFIFSFSFNGTTVKALQHQSKLLAD